MIYRAFCTVEQLREFMKARRWTPEDMAEWLGTAPQIVEWWLGSREQIPGTVARLIQIEEEVGKYLTQPYGAEDHTIRDSYFDAKNAFSLEFHNPSENSEDPGDYELFDVNPWRNNGG
jgi:transcriptional regulator with XRE-family HTH domain